MRLLLVIAVLPVIALCAYVYHRDLEKEPRHLLGRLFFLGCISVIPAGIIESLLDTVLAQPTSLPGLFVYVLLGVALVEEAVKWLIVYLVSYKSPEFNHHYDAIVYAVFVSLGFALVENIGYVFSYGIATGIARAFTAIPCHTCTAVFMGLFLGYARLRHVRGQSSEEALGLASSIAVPVFAHAVYDYLFFAAEALGTNPLSTTTLLFLALLYGSSFLIVRKVSLIATNFDGTPIIRSTW